MSESGSAFPDSIQLFRKAFSAPDPVSSLLQLLKDRPIYHSIRDLIFAYIDEIDANPHNGQALTSILLKLRQAPDAPRFLSGLSNAISAELAETFFKHPREIEVTVYGPTNEHLLNTLVAGLSLQHDLGSGGDELAVIQDGLNAIRDGSEESEVLVVGTCIQLLMAGHVILSEDAGTYKMSAEEIAMKVKSRRRCVKNPRAVKVVDLAISHANSGLKAENNLEDVWSLLFPRESQQPAKEGEKI